MNLDHDTRLHLKKVVDRANWLKVSRCETCKEIFVTFGPWEAKESAMIQHFFKTRHSGYSQLILGIVCADSLDHDWLESFGERQREQFELLKQSDIWKRFEQDLERQLRDKGDT